MKKLTSVFCLAFLAAACAKPPTVEIAAAQDAINAALQAGAEDYAPEQYHAAQDALTAADTQSEAKDYKAAKSSAVEAKQKAEAAVAAIEAGKAKAKTEAEARLATLTENMSAVSSAASKVKDKSMLEEVATLKSEVGNAKADFEAGRYKAVLDKSGDLMSLMDNLKPRLETAVKNPPKIGGKTSGKKKR
jgi:hypothetical protein